MHRRSFFDAFFCRFNEAPSVILKASPNPVVNGQTVTLDASQSSDDGEITSWTWSTFDSVNDVLSAGSTKATRTVDVPNGGTIQPSVTLTDNEGASATGTVDLVVVPTGPNQLPVASIAVEEDPPLSGRFTHFTGRWNDDGRIVRAEWDFDGVPGFEIDEQVPRGDTLHEARFTYATPGPYSVSFRVTDDRGGQATALTDIVVVPGQGPTAVLSIPSAPGGFQVGSTITLDARASSDDVGVTEYRFDKDGVFNNGFEYLDDQPPIGVTTTVLPQTPGPFTVGVRVFDAQRQQDDEYATIDVIGGRARIAAAPRPVRFSARLSARPANGAQVKIRAPRPRPARPRRGRHRALPRPARRRAQPGAKAAPRRSAGAVAGRDRCVVQHAYRPAPRQDHRARAAARACGSRSPTLPAASRAAPSRCSAARG